ncbi:MAG: SagB/ThcOx family dehydrogenase [bacterium]
MKTVISSFLILICSYMTIFSQNKIQLPKPELDKGKSLMECLEKRQTTRTFTTEKLNNQKISNILWAANGLNRPEDNRYTAPTAMNMQELSLYLAKDDGLYFYNPIDNSLEKLANEDIRKETGTQVFVGKADFELIIVADIAKMGKVQDAARYQFYAGRDAGYISQNIYLICASEGIGTVARGSFDNDKIVKLMKLDKNKFITLVHTIGYIDK